MLNRFKLLISGLLIATLSACSNQDFTAKPEITLLIVGDSLSAAYQINSNQSWTKLLQDKFDENSMNVRIVNISESGNTTNDALDKSSEHLEAKADVVLLNIGANDALKKIPITQTQSNFKELIDGFNSSSTNPKIMLVNITPPSMLSFAIPHIKAYTTIVPEIAQSYNLPYIENLFTGLNTSMTSNEHFLADKIHPNESAQPIISETIYKAIKPLIIQRHNNE